MRTMIATTSLTFCFLACSDPWSPVGTYNVIQLWKQGNCNLLMPRDVTVTVSVDPSEKSGYAISANIGTDLEGVILNTSNDCTLSFSIIEPQGTGLGFLGESLSIYSITERDGDLSGSGMFTVGSPENCVQAFTVEGDKE